MDKLGLEYARKRKNLSRADMGQAIGKSPDTYAKKENGEIKFSLDEVPIVARVLELTSDQVNAIFLMATYQFGKLVHMAYRLQSV